MPLPEANIVWPPYDCEEAYANYRFYDAWYSGDPDRLTNVYEYGGHGVQPTRESSFEPKPAQSAGGIVGMFARMFWGKPQPSSNPPAKMHIPLAGDISATAADTRFAEPPKIYIPAQGQKKSDTRLQFVFEENGLDSMLLEAAELASAFGGVFLRINIDTAIKGVPILTAVSPDVAVPEFRWGQLTAVTFFSTLERNDKSVIRHLERHEPGYILNGLYEGTPEKLGVRIPLVARYETEMLVDSMFLGDETVLSAVYIPNVKPNRLNRGSDLGRSDYSGIEGVMDSLDQVWSSWMRDIENGKGRISVPQDWLQYEGEGKGSTFDTERQVYSPLSMITSPQNPGMITISQFAIRSVEHSQTARELTETAVRMAGYAPRTFGYGDQVATTATGDRFLERKSLATRARGTRYWQLGLRRYEGAVAIINNHFFPSEKIDTAPVTVEFAAPVQDDPLQLSQTLNMLKQAEAASTEIRVRMLHPDWEKKDVDTEVERIMEETGASVADPEVAFGQVDPQNPDEPPNPDEYPEGDPQPGEPPAEPPQE